MSQQNDLSNATDGALLEAQFDRRIAGHGRMVGSLILLVTVVGIPLIPFWLLFSLWYYPEYLRRISARLTSHTLEVQKGVFFRSEATIPLNRITDLRLHDGPIMRYYNLRGLKVETAGMSGDTGSEGDLVGVVDASEFRDAVLSQRQKVLGREEAAGSAPASEGISETLVEIRDILARIEEQGKKYAQSRLLQERTHQLRNSFTLRWQGHPVPEALPSSSTIGLYTSNNDLGNPDCRMIDRRVPMRISRWSGTGTVTVV